ncbi:MAG: hypothetical protein PHN84_05840 [Desulfuromonadaceae bacterium]|nr:hypothetical protein [Desulfuromonadaceae bacterium]MDD2855355.1 hypothetical protein [Desulfuromonadaceae bacterium]
MKPASIVETMKTGIERRERKVEKPAFNLKATMSLLSGMSYSHFPLIIPGVHRLAAPLIMFRLKRRGYSNCRVDVTEGGLIVYAVR